MATNKNQHFVPRCYLRPFTIDEDNKAINLYNIDQKKFIPKAPVKNQCSKDYFYGQDDQLEQAIQLVESGYAQALRSVLSSNKSLSNGNKIVLRTFWLFQHLRTEAAAERSVKMSESNSLIAGIETEYFKLGIKEAVLMTVRMFAETIDVIDDLKFCIFRNKTKQPFLTSDDPAVLTNKWHLENKRGRPHSFGLLSAGAIIILPISSKLLFLGYDGDVYNITHNQGVIDIKSERDVIAINQHQLLNCRANIFLHDSKHSEMVIKAFNAVEYLRPEARHIVRFAALDSTHQNSKPYVETNSNERDKHQEAILHSQIIYPKPQIWPSQIKIRANGYTYTNGTAMGYARRKEALRHTGIQACHFVEKNYSYYCS